MPNSDISFEQAISELEEIVNHLESGKLPLEQALEEFEKGIGLVKESQKKLTIAEQKVSILTKSGELTPLENND